MPSLLVSRVGMDIGSTCAKIVMIVCLYRLALLSATLRRSSAHQFANLHMAQGQATVTALCIASDTVRIVHAMWNNH